MEGILGKNLILLFLIWWYTESPGQFWDFSKLVLKKILTTLSVKNLLKTFFAPWKKITSDMSHKSLNEKIHAMEDNMVSRLVGACTRSILLLLGLTVLFFSFIFFVIFWLIWAILPFLPILIFIYSLRFLFV